MQLITSLYSDYDISILTGSFMTSTRAVLQGDSLLPLLFNLIVKTLINTAKSKKIKCMGYVYQGYLSPKHWFQFVDYTATVTALEKDNQLICNVFIKWTTWADLIIRVDKCHAFGIEKNKSKKWPVSAIHQNFQPPIENVKYFTYFGRDFNFLMNCDEMETELRNEIVKDVDMIDKFLSKCLHQMEIIQRYVISKSKWQFPTYNLFETW